MDTIENMPVVDVVSVYRSGRFIVGYGVQFPNGELAAYKKDDIIRLALAHKLSNVRVQKYNGNYILRGVCCKLNVLPSFQVKAEGYKHKKDNIDDEKEREDQGNQGNQDSIEEFKQTIIEDIPYFEGYILSVLEERYGHLGIISKGVRLAGIEVEGNKVYGIIKFEFKSFDTEYMCKIRTTTLSKKCLEGDIKLIDIRNDKVLNMVEGVVLDFYKEGVEDSGYELIGILVANEVELQQFELGKFNDKTIENYKEIRKVLGEQPDQIVALDAPKLLLNIQNVKWLLELLLQKQLILKEVRDISIDNVEVRCTREGFKGITSEYLDIYFKFHTDSSIPEMTVILTTMTLTGLSPKVQIKCLAGCGYTAVEIGEIVLKNIDFKNRFEAMRKITNKVIKIWRRYVKESKIQGKVVHT